MSVRNPKRWCTNRGERRTGCSLLFAMAFGVVLNCDAPLKAGTLSEDYVEGVRIEAPAFVPMQDRADALEYVDQPLPPADPAGVSGWGYLRFYGCVSCHDLPDPTGVARWGPDLDRIGEKTTGDWLECWLENPSAALPGSRMPRVPLSDAERRTLTDFLLSLPADSLPSPPDGYAAVGKMHYEELQCSRCHSDDGWASGNGPSLRNLASRLSRRWLVAFLQKPTAVVGNSRMPDYGLTASQASDLATFLIGDDNPGKEQPPDSNTRGIGLFAEKGCAGCHRLEAYSTPLPMPVDGRGFIDHHRVSDAAIGLSVIPDARAAIMADALVSTPAADRSSTAEFLEAHWETPIPEQGFAPSYYDSLARDLSAQSCGRCHGDQLSDWTLSLHQSSMGPGVVGQLIAQAAHPGFVDGCQACHAPLWEQMAMVPSETGYDPNYRFRPDLQGEGLTCTVCHVRGHVRIGPPQGKRPPASVWSGPGHGGGLVASAFGDSRFCSRCHQFQEDGFKLNGKLLQDTYEEWLKSPHADAGATCQSCHMPERRHVWKGIHDAKTVREALAVDVLGVGAGGDSTAVEIRISNEGAGHHLPTYVTPKLMVKARWGAEGVDGDSGWDGVRAIGREVILTGYESREVFDKRIPAGGVWVWRLATEQNASAIRVVVDVHPDHFYLGFFESYDRDGLDADAAALIDAAEANARSSPYELLSKEFSFRAEVE